MGSTSQPQPHHLHPYSFLFTLTPNVRRNAYHTVQSSISPVHGSDIKPSPRPYHSAYPHSPIYSSGSSFISLSPEAIELMDPREHPSEKPRDPGWKTVLLCKCGVRGETVSPGFEK